MSTRQFIQGSWKNKNVILGEGRPLETRFPGNFAIRIEVPHGVAAFLVLVQNLSDQPPFGQFRMIGFNILIGDIDPESQGPVHSDFHC